MAADVLALADGCWPRLLIELAGLRPDQLQNRHQPCPACGGTDRYRWDRDEGPGGWFCNQCGGRDQRGGGGNGMDLLCRVTGWDFATAARRIEQHLGASGPAVSRPTLPAPAACRSIPPLRLVVLDEAWPITTGNPYVYGPDQCIQRLERGGRKRFVVSHRTVDGWCNGAGPQPWPMYQWPALLQATGRWVIELEGEKCADLVIQEGFLATTQPGHAHRVSQIVVRYQALVAAGVAGLIYLSDHDAEGQRRAEQVIQAASEAALPLLHLAAGDLWDGLPVGGSIDDAPGVMEERVAALLRAARQRHALLASPPDPPAGVGDRAPLLLPDQAASPPVEEAPDSGFPSAAPFACLGFDADSYYYQPCSTGQVVRLSGSAHSGTNLCRLAPIAWWETLYPSRHGINWTAAVSDLFMQQAQVGMFDPAGLRGRGAWWDRSRSVLHLGDRLIVDGCSQSIRTPFESDFHYQRGAALVGPGELSPLTDQEAFTVLMLAERFHWDVPASALLLAGWVTLAPICGVLRWRPHLWLTASAGAGKSEILRRYVGVLLADIALIVESSTTEAGIRQALRSDALPVVFDEAESNERADQQRIQGILALARAASSESQASTLKGTACGEVSRFRIRSMFLLSSINTALKQGADRRRFAQLTLRKATDLPSTEREAHWDALDRDLELLLDGDYGPRLIGRTVGLIPVIRRSVAVFCRVCARHFGSQALGDQYGTLLAGAWSLQSAQVPTPQQAQSLIDGADWSSYQQSTGLPDERRCLNRILQHQLRVETDERVLTRTVGELVELLAEPMPSALEPVSLRHAEDLLSRHGLRVMEQRLLISNTAEGIARILIDTPWATSWCTTLGRLPGAAPTPNPVRFKGAGSKDRACAIPLDTL